MPHPDRRQRACDLRALGRRGDREPLTQAAAARVDPQLAPGLGIDEVQEPDVRELLLAWVAHLDRHDVVVSRELEIHGSHGMPARDYPGLLALIASGALRPDRLVRRVIDLDQAGAALAAMSHPATSTGMTVVSLGDSADS